MTDCLSVCLSVSVCLKFMLKIQIHNHKPLLVLLRLAGVDNNDVLLAYLLTYLVACNKSNLLWQFVAADVVVIVIWHDMNVIIFISHQQKLVFFFCFSTVYMAIFPYNT